MPPQTAPGVAPPILFEALPPPRGSDHTAWASALDALEPLRKVGLWGINVPEILDGQYQTVEPRAFACALQRRLGVRALANRVTVHHSPEALDAWAAETRLGFGVRDLVLVGPERGQANHHAGIGVLDALRRLAPATRATGGQLGVVTIPGRQRAGYTEAQRLADKAAAGADFAISQILLDPTAATHLATEVAASNQAGRPAPRLYWSLAPVAKPRDVAFLRWLGVDVPKPIEETLLAGTTEAARLAASRTWNLDIAQRLLEAGETAGIAAGFCVEHVMQSNLEAAVDLVHDLHNLCRDFAAARAVTVTSNW